MQPILGYLAVEKPGGGLANGRPGRELKLEGSPFEQGGSRMMPVRRLLSMMRRRRGMDRCLADLGTMKCCSASSFSRKTVLERKARAHTLPACWHSSHLDLGVNPGFRPVDNSDLGPRCTPLGPPQWLDHSNPELWCDGQVEAKSKHVGYKKLGDLLHEELDHRFR